MDKDEDLPSTDHRVEMQILDSIGNSL
jgi:hypothetical protein